MSEVSHRFFKGQHIEGVIPSYLLEHMLAKHYGWSLSEIRSMSYYDFMVHLRICMVRENIDFEHQALLAGARSGTGAGTKPKKGTRQVVSKKFDPDKNDFV